MGRRLLALAVGITLLSAACTSASSPGAGEPTPGEQGDLGTPVEPAPQPSSQVFSPGDDVLNVAVREPSTLDPMRIGDPGSVLAARQLFEGLTRWDPVEEEVVPAAARRWTVRDGGRTFVFKLRPGMTFHDGTPVTAQDFRFAFDRIAAASNASDVAYTLALVDGFDRVNRTGSARHLSGVRAPDPATLVITLSEPYQDFPVVLTHPALVPLQASAVRDIDTFLSTPVGNGPFQMAQPWAPGQPVILKVFPGFISTPALEGIRLLPYPDAAASWLQLVRGDLHVAEVPAGQIATAERDYGDGAFTPLLSGYYLGLNLDTPNLRSLPARRAISLAIDREHLAGAIFRDTLQPARGIVPQGMPGFIENICPGLCDHRPAVARSLVRKLPDKQRSVVLDHNQGPIHAAVARAVAADLRAVGLRVEVRSSPFDRYVERLSDGDTQVFRLGWLAEYPSPDAFLDPLLGARSPDNHSSFVSAEIDRLLAAAHAEPSRDKRLQLYLRAEELALRKLPLVPIGSFVSRWAVQPEVSNLHMDVTGGFDAAGVELQAAGDQG